VDRGEREVLLAARLQQDDAQLSTQSKLPVAWVWNRIKNVCFDRNQIITIHVQLLYYNASLLPPGIKMPQLSGIYNGMLDPEIFGQLSKKI
jgi:hypothetical protein